MDTAKQAGRKPYEFSATESSVDTRLRPLLKAGAWSAMLFVVLVFIPLFLVSSTPVVPAGDGQAILEYIIAHPVSYIVQLVSFVGLSLPALVVFAALGSALFYHAPSTAILGGLLGIASEIVALAVLSSPQSLHAGLVVLAFDYMKADVIIRPSLEAAALALAANANTVTPAGIMTALAIFNLSLAMRRAGFPRALAVFGVVSGILGIFMEALRPFVGPAYIIYGLALPFWFFFVGLRLFKLAGQTSVSHLA
jgi:hypothetical protein